MVFAQLLKSLRRRPIRDMQQQTTALDGATRDNLQEFLEEQLPPDQIQETERIQTELDTAHAQLLKLQEKERFLDTRLKAYQQQMQKFDPNYSNHDPSSIPEDEKDDTHTEKPKEESKEEPEEGPKEESKEESKEEPKEEPEEDPESKPTHTSHPQYQKNIQALQKIQNIHEGMLNEIQRIDERIQYLEGQRLQLQQLTEECQAVKETATHLQQLEKGEDDNDVEMNRLAEQDDLEMSPVATSLSEKVDQCNVSTETTNVVDAPTAEESNMPSSHDEETMPFSATGEDEETPNPPMDSTKMTGDP